MKKDILLTVLILACAPIALPAAVNTVSDAASPTGYTTTFTYIDTMLRPENRQDRKKQWIRAVIFEGEKKMGRMRKICAGNFKRGRPQPRQSGRRRPG